MSVPIDDQGARDRIVRDALGETLFVEAGAGSGKTTALVGRVMSLVLEAAVPITDIAAITFTEAAAAELSTRVRSRLQDELDTPGSEVRRERADAALRALDGAAITTLHGFAARILHEHAVEAGLPPAVGVVDPVASAIANTERWERFVDRLHDDPDLEELLTRSTLFAIPFEPAYAGQRTLQEVAAAFDQNWDRLAPIVAEEHGPLPPPDLGRYHAAAEAIRRCLDDQCTDRADKFAIHLETVVLPLLDDIDASEDAMRIVARLAELRQGTSKPVGSGRGGRASAWVDGAPKYLIDDLNEAIVDVVDTAVHEVLVRIAPLVAADVLEAAAERRSAGRLEFHDLLVLTRNLLQRSESARRALHARFRHLLLDEFQDTDPIQIELAVRIAGAVGDGRWADVDVDPGRLFFVGDPKQSIYRFRRADIALFLEARDRFGGEAGPEILDRNFRTVRPILDWVNTLFHQLMGAGEGAKQPAYQPLVAVREADSGARHEPVLLGGPHPDPKVRAAGLRELEADDVAGIVRDILDDPEAWPVRDEERSTGGQTVWRPATAADITILLPTRTSLPFLRAALDERSVAYRLATGTLVYATQEVADLLAVLRAVDDPTDELALVAALRSPLYACSDVDLASWRAAGGHWDLRRSAPDGLDEHPVAHALAHLRSAWEVRWWTSPAALLDRIVRERRAAVLAFADRRPSDVWTRLRFLLDQARAFEEVEGGSLRDFVDWAALQSADHARVHEPMLRETDVDAVSIMTVHGSKGLEFPIAILSGFTTQLGAPRSGVRVVWNDDRPEIALRSSQTTAGFDAAASIESEMDVHERVRLLYVGLTRASDHLIVSAHHKVSAAEKSFGGIVWDDTDRVDLWRRHESPTLPVGSSAPTAQAIPLPLDDRTSWLAARERLVAPQRAGRVRSATRVAADLARAAAPDVDQDDDRSDGELDDGPVVVRRRGREGTAVGSAVHGVLEVVDLAAPGALDDLVGHQCAVEGIEGREGIVMAMVRSALASDAVRLATTHAHHRELFVTAPVGAHVVEGYVDLLVEGPDGLVVVDWKTDTVRTEADVDAKLDHYEAQGATYAVAVEAVTGRPVVDCRFVFTRPDGPIERSVRDLPGVMAEVRAMLAQPARRSADG